MAPYQFEDMFENIHGNRQSNNKNTKNNVTTSVLLLKHVAKKYENEQIAKFALIESTIPL